MNPDLYEGLLGSLLPNLFPRPEKYEPIAPLSKEQMKEWDEIQNEIGKIKTLAREIDGRKSLFWTAIEKKLNRYNRDMKIENGMVMEKVEEKKNCSHPGQAQVGFCDGDCANCAINPNPDPGEQEC